MCASEASSMNHYAENRIRKFQLVHKLQRCFSSHYLFSLKDNLPWTINDFSLNYKVLPSSSFHSILKQRESIMQSYKLCFHLTLCVVLVNIQFFQCSSVMSQLNSWILMRKDQNFQMQYLGNHLWKIAAVFAIHLLPTNAVKILPSKDLHKWPLTS